MPQYAQDILFVAAVALAFVLLLRGVAKRLDRTRPRRTATDPAATAEHRDG